MAYGARLESVLGASPRGFESPILRHRTPGPLQVPWFLLPVVPLVLRAPSGPAAVCAGGRRPARESSAPRASLGASSRSPARPRRRPRALEISRVKPPSPLRAGEGAVETAIAFAGEKKLFFVHFSVAEVLPVSMVAVWGEQWCRWFHWVIVNLRVLAL